MRTKILIVEDNPDLIHILQFEVQRLGYETILASNGEEAVDMAATHLPDLILMDMVMPLMSGFEAARLIRQNPKTNFIPILAVTALDGHKYEEECFQSGCDDHIAKPFSFDQLGSRIKKLLDQKSSLRTLSP